MYQECQISRLESQKAEKDTKLQQPCAIEIPINCSVAIPLDSVFLGGQVEKTLYSEFTALEDSNDDKEHIIVSFPQIGEKRTPLVRIHSECLTGDLFGSLRCDCGPQLRFSLAELEKSAGYLIYLRQEGRGIGLRNKLKAYQLQDEGFDTFTANEKLGFKCDDRDFEVAAKALKKMGILTIRLITNNPDKVKQLEIAGITVESILATPFYRNKFNEKYLEAKRTYAGHFSITRGEQK